MFFPLFFMEALAAQAIEKQKQAMASITNVERIPAVKLECQNPNCDNSWLVSESFFLTCDELTDCPECSHGYRKKDIPAPKSPTARLDELEKKIDDTEKWRSNDFDQAYRTNLAINVKLDEYRKRIEELESQPAPETGIDNSPFYSVRVERIHGNVLIRQKKNESPEAVIQIRSDKAGQLIEEIRHAAKPLP